LLNREAVSPIAGSIKVLIRGDLDAVLLNVCVLPLLASKLVVLPSSCINELDSKAGARISRGALRLDRMNSSTPVAVLHCDAPTLAPTAATVVIGAVKPGLAIDVDGKALEVVLHRDAPTPPLRAVVVGNGAMLLEAAENVGGILLAAVFHLDALTSPRRAVAIGKAAIVLEDVFNVDDPVLVAVFRAVLASLGRESTTEEPEEKLK